MRRARIEIIKDQIFEFLDNQKRKIFTLPQLNQLFEEQSSIWELPATTNFNRFLEFLKKEEKLWLVRLPFNYRPITLACWGEVTITEILMSVRPEIYFSHRSALDFHELLPEETPIIEYINDEQTPKPAGSGHLEQGRIDAAFKGRGRISNNKITIGDTTVYLLSGKNTGRLGVIQETIPDISVPVRVTDLERTLIDIVVRPSYAGGTNNVLTAYRQAAPLVNPHKILSYLEQLQHIYPYHQAIGFYMEKAASFSQDAIEIFRALPRQFNFYLDYAMQETEYSEDWRIYYPALLGVQQG